MKAGKIKMIMATVWSLVLLTTIAYSQSKQANEGITVDKAKVSVPENQSQLPEKAISIEGVSAVSGGLGTKIETKTEDPFQDLVKISYPGNEDKFPSRSIMMDEPKNLEREGIYIWRDKDAVWNIRPNFAQRPGATCLITSSADLSLLSLGDNISRPNQESLTFEINANSVQQEPLRFTSLEKSITFDLRVGEKGSSGFVFLGSKNISPFTTRFELNPDNGQLTDKQSRESASIKRTPDSISKEYDESTGQSGSGGGASRLRAKSEDGKSKEN